jgi:hypothetical protein
MKSSIKISIKIINKQVWDNKIENILIINYIKY